MTNFFLYCIKKWFFQAHQGYPPRLVSQNYEKNYPEPKKCSICWVSHMFSIWEYHYSYGICFGTVYAIQNSTPNILSFFLSTPVGLQQGIFYVSHRDYIYIYIYYFIYTIYTHYIFRLYMYICIIHVFVHVCRIFNSASLFVVSLLNLGKQRHVIDP